MGLVSGRSLSSAPAASMETIKKFVKELGEVAEVIKAARDDFNEVVNENEEIIKIDESIKALREEKAEIIKTNPVIAGYKTKLEEAIEDKKQLIDDAKRDSVPRGEIELSIRALKKDLDIDLSTDIYRNIADMIDVD